MDSSRKKPEKPFSWVGLAKKRKEANKEPCEDYFEDKENVTILSPSTFKQMLKEKDVLLVMFHDPCDKHCIISKNHFAHASGKTQRENSAFAAVDCTREPAMCDAERMMTVPSFKLFSKGKVAATVKEFHIFNHARMKQFVERVPILNDWTQPDPSQKCEVGLNCRGR